MTKNGVAIVATDGILSYPLVLINWVDSYFSSSGWQKIENEDSRIVKGTSVGFMREDKGNIVLYPHIACNGDSDFQGSGIITIPKVCIVRIVRLKSDKNHVIY